MTITERNPMWQQEDVPDDWELVSQERPKSRGRYIYSELKSALRPGPHPEDPRQPLHQWQSPELEAHEATLNLDDLTPPTLYYLSKLIDDIPQLEEVYVEQLESNKTKHWAVLSERDYEAMDRIYDIEADTIDRFPEANLRFRVTVASDGSPSKSNRAIRIFDDR